MRRIAVLTVLLTAMLLTATACSGSSKPKVLYQPVPGNSELVVGKNRVAMAIVDKKNTPLLGAPGTSVQLQFRDSEGQPIGEPNDMTFVEALPGTSGFWVLSHQFDQAGQQNATVIINVGESKQSVDITFGIQAKGKAPMIGDPAPPTENATLSSQPNKKALTTDPSPNDAFYQMTVTQALAAHKPFVVVFATVFTS